MVPEKVIIHHSLTKDGKTVSWDNIREYHTQTNGWRDIGYHIGIEKVDNGYEALMGRMWDRQGAHTKGQNSKSLGICFIGNYDKGAVPDEMLKLGAKVIALWLRLFDLGTRDIYPHSLFASYKTCPGIMFDMQRLKKLVRSFR